MKVRDVMTSRVETISPDATVEQASRKMRDSNVGILPVVQIRPETILGTITDRDLVVRVLAVGRVPHLTTVREVMTPMPLWCYDDQTVTEVARLLEKNLLRRALVLDRNEKLVGIFSISDLAVKVANEKISGHVLSKISVAE